MGLHDCQACLRTLDNDTDLVLAEKCEENFLSLGRKSTVKAS